MKDDVRKSNLVVVLFKIRWPGRISLGEEEAGDI
jgi:hypothetical protein